MNINFIPAWDQGVLKPLEKLEVHKRGLRHKAVSVFLISDNNVLLQKRASKKYHTPGLWLIPAAHIPCGQKIRKNVLTED